MFALTRTQIINDDLGAFADMPRRLGRARSQKFNNVFWTAFINNSSFFTAARTNYIDGGTTNLGSDGVGLGLGVKGFRKMTSPSADGTKRIGNGMTPSILLVPPELEGIAEALYRNQNLGSVASSSANIYANKYKPVVQNRLSEAAFTGYSTTAWYLFGMMMKPMWAAFLNGNESPTVESADADFNTLGIQFRGYHDFGAGQNEYLAGLKSKGAA
jgi:phage major head subunit gpT-like protein